MAEPTSESTPTSAEQTGKPTEAAKDSAELGRTARALVSARAKEVLGEGDQARKPDATKPAEVALWGFRQVTEEPSPQIYPDAGDNSKPWTFDYQGVSVKGAKLFRIDGGTTDEVDCYFQGKDGQPVKGKDDKPLMVPVKRDYIADMLLETEGDTFLSELPDGEDKDKLAEHITNLKAQSAAEESQEEGEAGDDVDSKIGKYTTELSARLADLPPVESRNQTQRAQGERLRTTINALHMAQQVDGSVGVLLRSQAVEQALATASAAGEAIPLGLKHAGRDLEAQKEGAYEAIGQELLGNGLEPEQVNKAIELLKQGKLEELLDPKTQDVAVKALQEKIADGSAISDALLKGTNIGQIEDYLDAYTATLSEDDPKKKSWRVAKGLGYTGLALLAIVLGSTGVVISMASSGMNSRAA